MTLGQPSEQIHERAIEKRIALAQDSDGFAGIQGGAQIGGRRVVHVLGGETFHHHRHAYGVFLDPVRQMLGDDRARQAVTGLGRGIGDDIRRPKHPQRLQRDQLRVAWANAQTVEGAAHDVLSIGFRMRHWVTGISGRHP